MLFPELETKALLGRSVADTYGRPVGRIIGIDRNAFGELEGVQVESLGGNIVGVKARQLSLTPKNVTLTPEWKIEADELIMELTTLRSRVRALESLKGSNEIDGEIYDELLDSQKQGYLEKVKTAEALANSVGERLETLTKQARSLTKYLASAKLDHKSGHLDETSLKIARDSIEPTLRPLIAEKNELAAYAKSLEKVIPARISLV